MTTTTAASTPPPPLDDPSLENPLQCPPLRWGMIGCGRVSHDFTQALKHLPTASVVACAARSIDSAKAFAEKHKIPSHYGSYEELLADDSVQCVYVGNVHAFRREIVEKVLQADKHVLVEKPFACSLQDAEYLIGLAKERNLFMLEGMWTRFFPAVEQARRLVFGSSEGDGILGEICSVFSDFNFNASDSEVYPTSFFYNHQLGGGASFLVAPYPFAAVTMYYPDREPEKIVALGQTDRATGVDLQASIVLNYAPTGDNAPALDDDNKEENTPKLPGAGTAICTCGFLAESAEETVVLGTKGRLKIHTPGHCPTKLSAVIKGAGRGNSEGELEYDFPLPADTDEIIVAGRYFYPNSAGFAYEAAAVARCIAAGKKEAPQYTWKETLLNARLINEMRSQLGVQPLTPPELRYHRDTSTGV